MADEKLHIFSIVVRDTADKEFNVDITFEGSKSRISQGLLAAMQSEERIRSAIVEAILNGLAGNKISIGERIDLSKRN